MDTSTKHLIQVVHVFVGFYRTTHQKKLLILMLKINVNVSVMLMIRQMHVLVTILLEHGRTIRTLILVLPLRVVSHLDYSSYCPNSKRVIAAVATATAEASVSLG